MKQGLLIICLLGVLASGQARQTEIQYLSGTEKVHSAVAECGNQMQQGRLEASITRGLLPKPI